MYRLLLFFIVKNPPIVTGPVLGLTFSNIKDFSSSNIFSAINHLFKYLVFCITVYWVCFKITIAL